MRKERRIKDDIPHSVVLVRLDLPDLGVLGVDTDDLGAVLVRSLYAEVRACALVLNGVAISALLKYPLWLLKSVINESIGILEVLRYLLVLASVEAITDNRGVVLSAKIASGPALGVGESVSMAGFNVLDHFD